MYRILYKLPEEFDNKQNFRVNHCFKKTEGEERTGLCGYM